MTTKTIPNASIAKARAQGAINRRLRKEAQELSRTTLEGGATVFKDSPPGVGWVLEFGGHKCYMSTKALVEALWTNKYQRTTGVHEGALVA